MGHINICHLVPFLPFLPGIHAWGALGHMTVGYIAQSFVTSDTASWAQDILDIHNSSYLASVAPWADQYRETKAGKFSEPFHFIDAEDSPPTTCNINYQRDCGKGGCLASAIQKYTERVQDTSLSSSQRQQALRFLVHLLGDVTQPLHNENLLVGCNDVSVTYGSESTNLHAIWDTNMPVELVGGERLENAEEWAKNLTSAISPGGAYADMTDAWVAGMNLSDPIGSAMAMGADANAYVCSYVLAPGLSALESEDLSQDYYAGAVPVFELQIAKAGYRLATWLNMIYNATSGDDGGDADFLERDNDYNHGEEL